MSSCLTSLHNNDFRQSRNRSLVGTVNFTFGISASAQQQPACAYWNETTQTWRQNGVETFSPNKTHVACSTSHFTNFAAVYFLYNSPDDNTWKAPDSDYLQLLTIIVSSISLAAILFLIYRLIFQSKQGFIRVWSANKFLTMNLA